MIGLREIAKKHNKRDVICRVNGLTHNDIERLTVLIDCSLLLVKIRLDKFTIRDIINIVYNTVRTDLERCIKRNNK